MCWTCALQFHLLRALVWGKRKLFTGLLSDLITHEEKEREKQRGALHPSSPPQTLYRNPLISAVNNVLLFFSPVLSPSLPLTPLLSSLTRLSRRQSVRDIYSQKLLSLSLSFSLSLSLSHGFVQPALLCCQAHQRRRRWAQPETLCTLLMEGKGAQRRVFLL